MSTALPQLSLPLAALCLAALAPLQAAAQQAYGKVLDATPVYEEVAIPQQNCTEFGKQQRCENTTVHEEQLIGYEVLYEYKGQQYMQRMAKHPGKRIPINSDSAQHSYGSKNRASAAVATPGSKSYGSAAAGTPIVESIQYRSEDLDPLLNLDMRVTPSQRPRPQPLYGHPHRP